eukprot:SAG31_NODE_29202_length_399_cov_0.860000_1_plen_46_part_00
MRCAVYRAVRVVNLVPRYFKIRVARARAAAHAYYEYGTYVPALVP